VVPLCEQVVSGHSLDEYRYEVADRFPVEQLVRAVDNVVDVGGVDVRERPGEPFDHLGQRPDLVFRCNTAGLLVLCSPLVVGGGHQQVCPAGAGVVLRVRRRTFVPGCAAATSRRLNSSRTGCGPAPL